VKKLMLLAGLYSIKLKISKKKAEINCSIDVINDNIA